MKAELQQKLAENYPEFFAYLKDNDGPIMPMSFGFEVGDGWHFILDNLMGNIQNHIKWNNKELEFHILQVKEKFGGLRFYHSGGDEYINGMVSLAESISYSVCEHCGSTTNIGQTQGWITTICKDCFDAGKTNMAFWLSNEEIEQKRKDREVEREKLLKEEEDVEE